MALYFAYVIFFAVVCILLIAMYHLIIFSLNAMTGCKLRRFADSASTGRTICMRYMAAICNS
jgi:hypothetical protein